MIRRLFGGECQFLSLGEKRNAETKKDKKSFFRKLAILDSQRGLARPVLVRSER